MHKVQVLKVVNYGNALPRFVNIPHGWYEILVRWLLFMRCLVVVRDKDWAILCLLVTTKQDMKQISHISTIEPRNGKNAD